MTEFMGKFPEKPKKHHAKVMVFTAFIVILGFLIATSFFGFSFTGDVVKNFGLQKNGTIQVNTDLTIPELNLDGDFGKITIKGGSNSNLYVGNEKFYLGNSNNNYIIIEGYSGAISLDSGTISSIKGKATKVSVNGVPISPKTGGTLSVSIDQKFGYNFMQITGGVSIKNIDYITSGTITLNNAKNIFRIDNEEVVMKNFIGDLTIENNRFKTNGKVGSLEIKGKEGISIS